MSSPTVAAIMLTRDRPELAQRALNSFLSQTYQNKMLIVLNNGIAGIGYTYTQGQNYENNVLVSNVVFNRENRTIGSLRNQANASAVNSVPFGKVPDIFVHWDDDDWSHPRRIEEQVALLQASGKSAVGFRELLFWDTRPACNHCKQPFKHPHAKGCLLERKKVDLYEREPERKKADDPGPMVVYPTNCWLDFRNEAWLYSGSDQRWICGASMCYTRAAWEACPFDDAPNEDQLWWLKNAEKCEGVSGLSAINDQLNTFGMAPAIPKGEPRMVCAIHGSNTGAYDYAEMKRGGGGVWRRVPEWDEFCAREMKL